MPFKILCCDGGGIRGLITSLLIQDLDIYKNKGPIIFEPNGSLTDAKEQPKPQQLS